MIKRTAEDQNAKGTKPSSPLSKRPRPAPDARASSPLLLDIRHAGPLPPFVSTGMILPPAGLTPLMPPAFAPMLAIAPLQVGRYQPQSVQTPSLSTSALRALLACEDPISTPHSSEVVEGCADAALKGAALGAQPPHLFGHAFAPPLFLPAHLALSDLSPVSNAQADSQADSEVTHSALPRMVPQPLPLQAPQSATSPFYEGFKSKGASKGLRLALKQAVEDKNQDLSPRSQIRLQGPVDKNKFSLIEGLEGDYVVSGSILKGAFGKFRGAISLETGELLGIKELRSIRAPEVKRHRKPNTHVTRDVSTQKELKLIRETSKHLKVHEVVEYNGKVYIFQTWMSGDAWQLARKRLSEQERQALGRSLVHHVARDLQRCNAAGFVHHDIKLLNILWDDHGAIAVNDFGLARQTDAPRSFPGGTPGMYAPEIVAKKHYGPSSDVWSLGISYLHFMMQSSHCPLNWDGHSDQALHAANALNEAFFAWRQTMLTPEGLIDIARIRACETRLGRYFSEVLRRDPAMTQIILQHVLVPAGHRDAPAALNARLARMGLFDDTIQSAAAAATKRIGDTDHEKHNIQRALQAARDSRLNHRI